MMKSPHVTFLWTIGFYHVCWICLVFDNHASVMIKLYCTFRMSLERVQNNSTLKLNSLRTNVTALCYSLSNVFIKSHVYMFSLRFNVATTALVSVMLFPFYRWRRPTGVCLCRTTDLHKPAEQLPHM